MARAKVTQAENPFSARASAYVLYYGNWPQQSDPAALKVRARKSNTPRSRVLGILADLDRKGRLPADLLRKPNKIEQLLKPFKKRYLPASRETLRRAYKDYWATRSAK